MPNDGRLPVSVQSLTLSGVGASCSGLKNEKFAALAQAGHKRPMTIVLRLLLAGAAFCLGACSELSDLLDTEKSTQEKVDIAKKEGAQLASEVGSHGKEAMATAMDQVKKAIREAGVQPADPVPFRQLQKLLPAELSGAKQSGLEGQTSGAMGLKISKVRAEYKTEETRLTVKILDAAGTPMAKAFASAWEQVEIDKESTEGYERTLKYQGHPALEKLRSQGPHSKFKVVIAKRFLVELDGQGVPMKALKKALGQLDLSKLEKMKDVGSKKSP